MHHGANSMSIASQRSSTTIPTTAGMDTARALCCCGGAHTWVHASADCAIRPVPIAAGARLCQMRAPQTRGDAFTASVPSSSPETPRTAIPQQSRACVATTGIRAQSCRDHRIRTCGDVHIKVRRGCCTCHLPSEHGNGWRFQGNLRALGLSSGRICFRCHPILSPESWTRRRRRSSLYVLGLRQRSAENADKGQGKEEGSWALHC